MNAVKPVAIGRLFEDVIIPWAIAHDLDVLEIGGTSLFPIYSQSGGIQSKYICYFKKHGESWPENGDFGRENTRRIFSVLAVELEYEWKAARILEHLNEVYATYK